MDERSSSVPDLVALVAFPLIKFLIHVSVGGGIGYHRDELYYLANTDHLSWGYVDHPPFSILLLAVVRALFGGAPEVIRLVPAAAGALTVLLVGLMTRRLGGRTFGLVLAMLATSLAPFYLGLNAYYSMNALDILAWALAGWLLMRILQDGDDRLWPVLGLALGFSLLNKVSTLWLGFGLFAGLLLTPERRVLKTRGPWIAAAIAFLIFLPHVIWQIANGFPTLEFMRNAMFEKMRPSTVRSLILAQIGSMGTLSAPIWISGLVVFLFRPAGRGLRVFGWAWMTIFTILALSPANRGWYLTPAQTWLMAAGAAATERYLRRKTVRIGYGALIVTQGVFVAPIFLPMLSADGLAAYSLTLQKSRGSEERGRTIGALPEFLGHMSGWPEIVDTVAGVYDTLPADERATTMILVPNYGDAAAIDILGRRRGLPLASSGHNAYWMWGPPAFQPSAAIVVGFGEERLKRWFGDVRQVDVTRCSHCLTYEDHQPVWLARNPSQDINAIWSELKHYD